MKQKRKARTGFNPKTQQKIRIPAKTVLKFRVAKVAKDTVLGVKSSSPYPSEITLVEVLPKETALTEIERRVGGVVFCAFHDGQKIKKEGFPIKPWK